MWGITELIQNVLCFIKNVLYVLLAGVIGAVNLVIEAIGVLLSLAIALLPNMIDVPNVTGINSILGPVNWIFPVTEFITVMTAALVMYALFLLIRIVLRWVKAL